MFGNDGDGGLGFQLSMYRLIDDLDEAGRMGRENALQSQNERLRSEYNRLLTQAQLIERTLQERNGQLAAVQSELDARTQQLATTQAELKRVYERNALDAKNRRMDMIALQDHARLRARERSNGSQST